MINKHAWPIRGLTGRSLLPVMGSLVLMGALTAAAQPPAPQSATHITGSTRLIATISLGPQLAHLAYNVATDPLTHMIYVTEPQGLAVINGRTDKVVTTIPLSRGPHGAPDCPTSDILLLRLCNLATDPLTGRVYVTDAVQHAVVVIDGRTNKLAATIPVGGAMYWIAADPLTGTVFVQDWRASGNQVVVIDGRTDKIVARIPENFPDSFGIAVNPSTSKVYVNGGSSSGELVIDARTNKAVGVVPGAGGWGIATDPRTDTVTQNISLQSPLRVATDPLTHFVYVADDSNLVVVDGRTDTVMQTITLPSAIPAVIGIATDPLANRVYVTNPFEHTVSVLAGSK